MSPYPVDHETIGRQQAQAGAALDGLERFDPGVELLLRQFVLESTDTAGPGCAQSGGCLFTLEYGEKGSKSIPFRTRPGSVYVLTRQAPKRTLPAHFPVAFRTSQKS